MLNNDYFTYNQSINLSTKTNIFIGIGIKCLRSTFYKNLNMNMADKKSNSNKESSLKKKNCRFKQEYPFPIVRGPCQNGQIDPNWNCIEGYLQENCVLIYDDASIKLLYTHGFFGKGTQSKYAPKVCYQDETKRKDNQPGPSVTNPKVEVIEIDEENDEEEEEPKAKVGNSDEIVLSDSSMSDTERDFFPLQKAWEDLVGELTDKERLQLTFEEAYFLSYGLGCLVVKDKRNQYISLKRLWNIFCQSTPSRNFPAMYAAYHHFRSKGWVVKSGMKYGVNYILYKDGPPFYHAAYSIIVKPINFRTSRKPPNDMQETWASILSSNRLNNNTGKKLVFMYVTKPSTLTENLMSSPSCISSFKIKTVLLKRWVPAGNRKETD